MKIDWTSLCTIIMFVLICSILFIMIYLNYEIEKDESNYYKARCKNIGLKYYEIPQNRYCVNDSMEVVKLYNLIIVEGEYKLIELKK